MKKKTWIGTVLGLAIIGTAAFASACGSSATTFGKLETARDVYGFSAASAGTLISAMNGGSASQIAAADPVREGISAHVPASQSYGARPASSVRTVTDEETIATLNEYMLLVESLLTEGSFGIESGVSDRAEYAVMEAVSYRDLLGNTLEYQLYYNEIEVSRKEHREHDEVERNYRIEGVMVVDGVDYAIRGEREIEEEKGESETETEFYVELSADSYLVVKQEIEIEKGEEEQQFIYSLYRNGELSERSEIKYEQEGRETELKMSVYKNGIEQAFRFEEDHGKITVRVNDGQSEIKYLVRIVEENGETRYEYETKDGGKYTGKRG